MAPRKNKAAKAAAAAIVSKYNNVQPFATRQLIVSPAGNIGEGGSKFGLISVGQKGVTEVTSKALFSDVVAYSVGLAHRPRKRNSEERLTDAEVGGFKVNLRWLRSQADWTDAQGVKQHRGGLNAGLLLVHASGEVTSVSSDHIMPLLIDVVIGLSPETVVWPVNSSEGIFVPDARALQSIPAGTRPQLATNERKPEAFNGRAPQDLAILPLGALQDSTGLAFLGDRQVAGFMSFKALGQLLLKKAGLDDVPYVGVPNLQQVYREKAKDQAANANRLTEIA